MPHPMIYRPCLRGYAPYTQGIRSSLTEWIIRQIARMRKLANLFILFRAMNNFSYLILPIIHAYNAGISQLQLHARLWSEDLTPVGWRNSDHMPHSDWKMQLQSYARLRSHVRLRLEDATPVVCPTSIGRYDSGRISLLWSTSRLRSYLPTPVMHHGSGW
jgi:hypothetical protein